MWLFSHSCFSRFNHQGQNDVKSPTELTCLCCLFVVFSIELKMAAISL